MDFENATYESFGDPKFAYRITANEGYVIQLSTHQPWEGSKIVVLPVDYDMTTVKVVEESSLPDPPEDIPF